MKFQSILHREQNIFIAKTSDSNLVSEMFATYCENVKKHKNSSCNKMFSF